MADIYQIMEESQQSATPAKEPFDKDAWAARKQQEREQAFERADKAALLVNTDAHAREAYLGTMARFPTHSISNTLLIFDQFPDATRVGSSEYWSKQKCHIKKGEKALVVLEPGKEYVRDDGSISTFYDPRKVFDVSQTTARIRLPRAYDTHAVLAAVVTKPPVAIIAADDLQGELAIYDHSEQCIYVQKGLSEPQLFSALTTELAHASMARGEHTYDRDANANKAELASLILAKRYGIDVPLGESPAPAALACDAREVRRALTQVREGARETGDCIHGVLDRAPQRDKHFER